MFDYYNMEDPRPFVLQLQRMLSYIGKHTGAPHLIVAVDGIYGDATAKAVARYQSERELPADKSVGFNTWQSLNDEYNLYRELYSTARGITPFPPQADFSLGKGDRSQLSLFVQLILNDLRLFYDSYAYIPPGGYFDEATVRAVTAFQLANGLGVTGRVDRITWNRMAEQYDMSVAGGH